MHSKIKEQISVAFIGSAGIPNRYGGFESFLEHCAPLIAEVTQSTIVTCDSSFYQDDSTDNYRGVHRIFLGIRANGASSILHDLIAFFRVYPKSSHIMVLGVSGGLWFPLFLLMCRLGGKRLGVNIDGVEWRRKKFGPMKKCIIRLFDYLAQRFSDFIVFDNSGLAPYVLSIAKERAFEIAYSGNHVLRLERVVKPCTALTVCRIEPENNLDLIIDGALKSGLQHYTIVGNWNSSAYGRSLREYYQKQDRLALLDSIYDQYLLAELREGCSVYIHGHSIGGTNPSLVEMLYYDCALICFDVIYNKVTAGDCAYYFTNSESLANCIDSVLNEKKDGNMALRERLRVKYSNHSIASAYLKALKG